MEAEDYEPLPQRCPPCHASQRKDWRIAPEKINIFVGEERTLQALDDSAQELSRVEWFINDPSLATMNVQDGRLTLQAIKPGTVRVTAVVNGERRFLDVPIWADPSKIPPGSTHWGMHPIGREIGDIAAVPTDDGPNMLSLEQTSQGDTYLRGTREDGIQIWSWRLPEETRDVELICGDWLGGPDRRQSCLRLHVVHGGKQWENALEVYFARHSKGARLQS